MPSCSSEDDLLQINIGENFIKSQSSVVIIDTMKVNLSTVMIDSIPTSGSEQLLVGKYIDPMFGAISSTGFFQLDIPENVSINEKAVFDSLTLVLNYSGLWYGDTLNQQVFYVHRVLEDIEEHEDGSLYNTSTFKYDENPIGSLSFTPKPLFHDSVEIRMDDQPGLELTELFLTEADEISSSDDFSDYFKGLAIVPDENNSCILSFSAIDSLITMRLHTHYIAKEKVTTVYNFNLKSTTTCFNHVSADRTGTPIENLTTQKEEINSTETDDKSFLEGGLGIVTRVDFPGLGKLMEMDYRKILYKAELILKPYPNLYPTDELPIEIEMYTTDKYNRLVEEIVTSESEPQYADFYADKEYNENTFYQFDITSFILDELSDGYADSNSGLIIILPSDKFEGSLDRLVIDGRDGISYRPRINLYYVFYN